MEVLGGYLGSCSQYITILYNAYIGGIYIYTYIVYSPKATHLFPFKFFDVLS